MVYWVAALAALVCFWMTPVRVGILYVSGDRLRVGILIGPVRIQPPAGKRRKKKKAPFFSQQDVLHAVLRHRKSVRVEKIALQASFGTQNACHTALLCGLAGAVIDSIRVCFPDLRLQARLSPVFSGAKSQVRAGGIISFTIGHIIRTSIFLLFTTLSRRIRTWTSTRLKAS